MKMVRMDQNLSLFPVPSKERIIETPLALEDQVFSQEKTIKPAN